MRWLLGGCLVLDVLGCISLDSLRTFGFRKRTRQSITWWICMGELGCGLLDSLPRELLVQITRMDIIKLPDSHLGISRQMSTNP